MEQACAELERARATFDGQWRALYEDLGPEKLDALGINIMPLLKQQKKMASLFGSEIQVLDNHSSTREMVQLNALVNSYCPEGKIPHSYKCQVTQALKLQEKMNKTCALLLKRAKRREANEMRGKPSSIKMEPVEPEEEEGLLASTTDVPMEEPGLTSTTVVPMEDQISQEELSTLVINE